ncbi:uncharacterized protein LOC143914977 isoform X2 [Arctopsyche grandis]|uniref:uncharacterized protein LOC143914977 isoform X2 n=1 Tax=Arctopsyche grandis TaxID=121162 RepID=UPI00406D9F27
MYSAIILFLSFIALIYFSTKRHKHPKLIFNVYTVPGRWYYFKYLVFTLLLYFKYFYSCVRVQFSKDEEEMLRNKNETMDIAQPLSDHSKAFNAAFFIGANKDGYYMIAGAERRQMGVINGLFYLIIPGKGLLCSTKIPDTLLFGAKPLEFGAEGLLLSPIEPMKRWKVTYNEKMFQDDPSDVVNVSFTGEWTAIWKHFNYDTDLYIPAVARSIARENWSRRYFEDLKNAHQSHYEQFGKITMSAEIDGEKFHATLDSFRDHSSGHKRDWELMHRYAFHHIFCEDGKSATVGVICQPSTATNFEVGVVCLPDEKKSIYPLEWCNLELYQHGENGKSPVDYAFQFQAGGEVYTVEVQVHHQSEHFVSNHWDARMVERFVHYKVNGVQGWGVSEFHYNNKKGRPEKYRENDPTWYKSLHDY